MADDLTTTTTVATIPTSTKVMTNETTSRGHKQVVQTSRFARATANFSRPADTTAYASGDLVANSTTAGSVAAMQFTVTIAHTTVTEAGFFVRRARLKKSTTGVTNAAFRLHLYGTDPASGSGIANGDNGAFSVNDATYLGYIDFGALIAHRDCAMAYSTPAAGAEISHALSSGVIIYGLLEARGAYTPGNAETWTVHLEVFQL